MNPKIKSTKDILKDIINSFRDIILRSQIDIIHLITRKEQSPNMASDFSAEIQKLEAYQKQIFEKLTIAKDMYEKEFEDLDKKKKKVNIS